METPCNMHVHIFQALGILIVFSRLLSIAYITFRLFFRLFVLVPGNTEWLCRLGPTGNANFCLKKQTGSDLRRYIMSTDPIRSLCWNTVVTNLIFHLVKKFLEYGSGDWHLTFSWWLANTAPTAFVGERNDHMTRRLWRKRKAWQSVKRVADREQN
jgi:hypothetical protein